MNFDQQGKDFLAYLLGHWQRQEKTRFLVVGVYNTVFGYLAFISAYVFLGRYVHYLGILSIAHFLSVSNAFLGHKFLTFKIRGHLLTDFLRFNLTYLGTLAIGLVGLPLFVEICRIHPVASQAILSVINMVSAYFVHKRMSFRRNIRDPAHENQDESE